MIHQNKVFQCGRLHPFIFFPPKVSPVILLHFLWEETNKTKLLLRQGYCHGFTQVKIGPQSSNCVQFHEFVGFVTLLRNVDCDGCLAGNPALTVS